MSATVDCSLFSKYFSILINGQQEGAPIIRVDGKMFDVDEYYFEDISRLSEVTLSKHFLLTVVPSKFEEKNTFFQFSSEF